MNKLNYPIGAAVFKLRNNVFCHNTILKKGELFEVVDHGITGDMVAIRLGNDVMIERHHFFRHHLIPLTQLANDLYDLNEGFKGNVNTDEDDCVWETLWNENEE